MDSSEEMPNLESVCRLCLAADETKTPILATASLADKIQAYLSIQVTANDRISTFICSKCTKEVNRWHSYRESCQRSQDKLQQWLSKQTSCNQTIQIKDEPVDLDDMDNVEILSEPEERNLVEIDTVTLEVNGDVTSDEQNALEKEPENDLALSRSRLNDSNCSTNRSTLVHIKSEPVSEEDEDSTMDTESISDTAELVPNPMAIAKAKESGSVMEADSTQKYHATSSMRGKKKIRRFRTHFHDKKVFKRKCPNCSIYLHSKWAFDKHMERFHNVMSSGSPAETKSRTMSASKTIKKSKAVLPSRMSARIAEATLQQLEIEANTGEVEEDRESELGLTSMQLNIISQLKTYSCYTCQQHFSDRRTTLNHIRQHAPDLRSYTCIACLTEFGDRSLYKMHCSDSLECAMKIAQVVPKFGTEKYFTCNMCLEALQNRQELLLHISRHANSAQNLNNQSLSPSKQNQSFSKPDIPSPYMHGDPIHNHECDLCGMIYKHKINMQKHREHCLQLPERARTSYRCIHCGMTFLVYKKFQSHLATEHRRKDLPCQNCSHVSYSAEEFLMHHDTHRVFHDEEPDDEPAEHEDSRGKAYNCALCDESFNDLADYTEHRNLHLKVEIYSCVICRSMFSSAQTLEVHMKDHGIHESNQQQNTHHSFNEDYMDDDSDSDYADADADADASSVSDPGGQMPRCPECGNSFANTNNVTRHMKNVHRLERSICNQCYEVFITKDQLNDHITSVHMVQVGQSKPPPIKPVQSKIPSQRPILKCPQCFKVYYYESALHHHCKNVHGINYDARAAQKPVSYKCEVCNKTFKEEFSMRIHKTWHYRADSRLARGMPNSKLSPVKVKEPQQTTSPALTSTPKPAKARKSFPNAAKLPNASPKYQSIQCQVCDNKFSDVAELRKHLWEVHCAEGKQEKPFIINDLQCELCTNIFDDQESLDEHMEWHRANPILSNNVTSQAQAKEQPPAQAAAPVHASTFTCGICHKVYSTKKMLYKHKRIHKVPMVLGSKLHGMQLKKMAVCGTCNKAFSTTGNLAKHRAMTGCGMNVMKMKKEAGQPDVEAPKKKPVHCLICKSSFPSMRILYQHKQMVHNKNNQMKLTTKTQGPVPNLVALTDNHPGVMCNVCGKRFNGIPALKQHYTIKHKPNRPTNKVQKNAKGSLVCLTKNCRQEFPDQEALSRHELENHSNILYSCQMCERHFFDKSIIVKHVQNTHKAGYQEGVTSSIDFFEEIDLNAYEIENLSNPRECPVCHVRYPNTKALKIHYYKFHDKGFQ